MSDHGAIIGMGTQVPRFTDGYRQALRRSGPVHACIHPRDMRKR